MSELNLPACPICHAPESLVPATRTIQGETYTWHECRRCGSVLLFVGNGRWAYQKIGLDAQAHLLKKPLTAGELSALLPAAQPPPRVSPAVPARGEEPERRQAQAPAPVPTQRPASVSAPPAAGKPALAAFRRRRRLVGTGCDPGRGRRRCQVVAGEAAAGCDTNHESGAPYLCSTGRHTGP